MNRPEKRRWIGLAILVCVVGFCVSPASAEDDPNTEDDGFTVVPQVFDLRLGAARARLQAAGLRVRTPMYEMSWRRALDRWLKNVPIGTVIAQAPLPGMRVPRGKHISLIVSAVRDGLLPKNLPPASPHARGELGTTQRKKNDGKEVDDPQTPESSTPESSTPDASAPDAPAPDAPVAPAPEDPRAPDGEAPDVTQPAEPGIPAPPLPDVPKPDERNGNSVPSPDTPSNDDPLNDLPSDTDATSDEPPVATGSPEAPRPAPAANPDIVPPLMGLDLAVAEQLCRDAKMTVYVERVAGHPVGRVLEQTPEAYEPRGPGGIVKVIVTAGGDFTARSAPPAEVHVDVVDVPDVHDRTQAQAIRILRDLRLVGQTLPATRGAPGRVTNQEPLPGKRLPVGSLVKIYVAPVAAPKPPVIAPSQPAPPPAPPANTAPGAVAGAPRPVAPAGGTPMPKTAAVTIAFMWQSVAGATAYVLEVEEQGAGATWMQSVRKPVRKTAAVVEVERLDTETARPLRWRVRAVVGGRQSDPSVWIVLR